MQLAESAKSQFSCREYSDHLALVRAYEGWKDAEREQSGYEFCWRNFLSAQTLKAIDSLRKQFVFLLKDASLVDDFSGCNKWSGDQNLVRAVRDIKNKYNDKIKMLIIYQLRIYPYFSNSVCLYIPI